LRKLAAALQTPARVGAQQIRRARILLADLFKFWLKYRMGSVF
jgi:hypothetical protein